MYARDSEHMEEASTTLNALRTACLAFSKEIGTGVLTDRQLAAREDVMRVLRPRAVPPVPVRGWQRLAMKAGRLDFESGFLSALRRMRAQTPEAANGAPRFLIRVDEYPDSRAFDDGVERWRRLSRAFHDTLAAEGVPYLMAIVPQFTHRSARPRFYRRRAA